MSHWTLILIAALGSYALRALPILFFHRFPLTEQSLAWRFLSYAAFAVMGGIIYSALLGDAWYSDWQGHFDDASTLIRLATLAVAVIVAARYRGVFRTLFVSLTFFMLITALTGV
ncbi:hypothetical protein ASF84_06345 [Pseudomonas sp. Leaf127]|uniref:AzlD domain-containing protein n=1 Tax=Pseudomonas TaxID=286 RepID=UPI000702504D|nr:MULTISPECIES: AzlD domain-containing protein [Pseudomonas]KQQ60311.1 hypothetical protein ASF84_06345 [Pseudomonas sp. Leaf127]